MSKNEISRRSLLKTMVAGAAVVGGGLALNLAAPSTAEATVKKLPTTSDDLGRHRGGFGICGIGGSGEAAGAGSKVVILEKMPVYGGDSIINGGEYNAWETSTTCGRSWDWATTALKCTPRTPSRAAIITAAPTGENPCNATPTLNWMIDEGGLKLRRWSTVRAATRTIARIPAWRAWAAATRSR